MEKGYFIAGIVFIVTSILLGAFGSHALKPIIPEDSFYSYTVATSYLGFQGLGLLVLGIVQSQTDFSSSIYYCLFFGTVLFCGSILLLVGSKMMGWNARFLGPVTPVGGLLLILGWGLLLKHFILIKG